MAEIPTIRTSKITDVESVDFYQEFFDFVGWSLKPFSISKDINDLSLTNFALVVTADGDLYGINRNSGKIKWILRGLNSVMKSKRDLVKMDNQFKGYKQYISNNVDFFWFLEPVDDGSIYVFDFRIGFYKLPFNIKQLIKLSPYSFPGDDKIYIGKKETSLFVVNADTGRIYQSFGSDYQYDDSTQCFFGKGFGKYYDEKCSIMDTRNKNVLKIGRIGD